ncbi:hypothetical protein NPIL_291241 [Nephila pilipes]|uniref:RED-like N-terminal domain-containing protein n=1 Tax=Nephila pilipes TaxID=299642 RepID=A0A8X6U8G2_NEPPI|nr:hypothetical protein NPIL_291241 [Nephila pilipes]
MCLVYGYESPSDNGDVKDASEEGTEDPSVSTGAGIKLLSTESGNEKVTQRYRDRVKERRGGVNLDYDYEEPFRSAAGYLAKAPVPKSGLDTTERKRQMIQESKYLKKRITKKDHNVVHEELKSYFEKLGMDDEKQRERVNEWDNILSSEYSENAEVQSENRFLFGVHKGNDCILKAKLTQKLMRDMSESCAECNPGAPEEYSK